MANWSIPPQVPRRRQRFWNYPRPYRRGWRAWVPSWRIVVGTILTGVSLATGVLFMGYTSTVIPEQGEDVGNQTTTVYYADNSVMGEFAALDRIILTKEQLPNWDLITSTLVASEDQTFWTNSGVDPMGIVRAFLNNVTGGAQQGGSTLTQQYVEAYYGSGPTYKDKVREVILAYKVTQAQDKEEIIERYINSIYFGRKAYGIQAASQAYFGIDAAALNYNQVAFLIGIIPSPNQWDGKNDPEFSRAWGIERWERSIRFMAEQGVITPEEKAAAVFPEPQPLQNANSKSGYTGYLLDMVEAELASRAQVSQDKLMTNGYKVYTTIDKRLMDAAMATMALPADANPLTRASLTSIDPSTGAIRSIYGGPDYLSHPTNAATVTLAQGGSTFKPFTLIGGLEEGISIRKQYDGNDDIVIKGYNNGPGDPDRAVTNFADADYGQVDLIKATQDSINTAYVALNVEIGAEKTAEVGYRLGIPEETCIAGTCAETIQPVLSNVLGSAAVRNIDLTHAYATIAASGVERDPYIIQKVTDLRDAPVYDVTVENNPVVNPEIANATTYAMTQVVEKGSGKPARDLGRPAAGKTGTASENKSAWFAGYTPQLVTVVGLSQYNPDNPEEKNEDITPFGKWAGKAITGGTWPVEAWTAYMKIAMEGQEIKEFPEYKLPKPSASPSPTPSPTPTQEGVQVPGDLVGRPIEEVRERLQQLGLRAQERLQESNEPKGTVIQVDNAGQMVGPGANIPVTVSSGPATQNKVRVPNVVGMTQRDATNRLTSREYQLTPAFSTVPSSEADKGKVMSMQPGADTEVDRNSIVTLVVGAGPDEEQEPSPSPTVSLPGGGNGGGNGGGILP